MLAPFADLFVYILSFPHVYVTFPHVYVKVDGNIAKSSFRDGKVSG
jgi:hypothetical protein